VLAIWPSFNVDGFISIKPNNILGLSMKIEGVTELFSHRDDRASRIVSSFLVGGCDNETQTQREEHLRSYMNAASDVRSPEAAALDRFTGSFDATPAVVRLV